MKNLIFIFSIIIGSFSPSLAQNFDRYTTLQSAGPMPLDWSMPTYEKIEQDKIEHADLYRDPLRRTYLEELFFGVDQMIHSGEVVYGDPVSNYVTSISNRLLANEPQLKQELRFYTIKSNVTNAFSTRQGIIFVTTGLISQLSNEAQLAFVLAHEISHYKREHMLDRYEYNKKNYYKFSIEDRVQFSQNHEIEADADGIKLYQKAGYSVDELVNSFDVLMYSYLPFDEVPFNMNFVSYGKFEIPQKFNPGTTFPITAYEDYDDSFSSHPNIKKRKDAALAVIADIESWGNTVYFEGEQNFINIRNITRFESIRTDIMNGEMGKALYSVYVLQQNGQFLESNYLNEAKAFAWYGIARYNAQGSKSSTIPKKKEFEGESATLYNMINLLPKEAIPYLALRNIYEIYKLNPDDSLIIKMVYDFSKDFKSSKTDRITLLKAQTLQEASLAFKLKSDSISKVSVKDTVSSTSSKYDRIKSKKTEQGQSFDSTKFYIYGFSDVLSDSKFMSLLKNNRSMRSSDDGSDSTWNEMEHVVNFSPELSGGTTNKIFLIEPSINVSSGKYSGNLKLKAQHEEKLTNILIDNLLMETAEQGIGLETLTPTEIFDEQSTAKLNERNLILSNLKSKGDKNQLNLIPFDFQLLDSIANKHNSELVTFLILNQEYSPEYHPTLYLGSILMPVVLPFILAVDLPYCVASGKQSELTYMQLNIRTGQVTSIYRSVFQGPINKLAIENCIYHTFNN